MKKTKECSECHGREIYRTTVDAGGGHAPDLLPGTHPWWGSSKFEVYVCGRCGHYQLFVPEDYLARLREKKKFEVYS